MGPTTTTPNGRLQAFSHQKGDLFGNHLWGLTEWARWRSAFTMLFLIVFIHAACTGITWLCLKHDLAVCVFNPLNKERIDQVATISKDRIAAGNFHRCKRRRA